MGLALPKQPAFLVKENLDELAELARSTGISVVGKSLQNRQAPDGRTLIGRGKVNEIARAVDELSADIVIFDPDRKEITMPWGSVGSLRLRGEASLWTADCLFHRNE